jgi:hypothetical protein
MLVVTLSIFGVGLRLQATLRRDFREAASGHQLLGEWKALDVIENLL